LANYSPLPTTLLWTFVPCPSCSCLSSALLLINSSPPGRDLITPCGRTYSESCSHTPFATTGTRQTRTLPFPTSPPLFTAPAPVCTLSPPSPNPLHAAPHSARVVCRAIACSVCLHVLTRVPGPPIGVTRLGSPASPRIVPVDAAAYRAHRDPGDRNRSQVLRRRRRGRPPP